MIGISVAMATETTCKRENKIKWNFFSNIKIVAAFYTTKLDPFPRLIRSTNAGDQSGTVA